MSEKKTAFRLTVRCSFDYQIIVQAKDYEEATYFTTDTNLDKWIESGSVWAVLDVSKTYPLKRVKVVQDVELSNQISEMDQICIR